MTTDPLGWNKPPAFDRDKMNPLARQMLEVPGNEFAFEIARQNVVEGTTFSSDAFDGFLTGVAAFLGSRLVLHWERTGEPPQKMRVIVLTSLEGSEPAGLDQARTEVTDPVEGGET
jgi:hypothetical protein